MATEQVIIEFISDTSKLEPGISQLEKIGKVEKSQADDFRHTNAEINKQVAALKNIDAVNSQIGKSGTTLKKSITDINTAVKGMSQSFLKEFRQGAAQALKEAGVSAEQFETALEGVNQETVSLRSQIRNMTQALAQMKVEGKDNTEQYRALAQEAAKLKSAIGNADKEVRNFASDTSTIDGVISLTQGLAGGFAVVQGGAALFGDESEELQKTLLRVNAAMAILQGLQGVQNLLQKESAAATLANTIALRAQTGAHAAFNFVVGTSTGLLKLFRIALAATGVGLLVIGLYELVQALKDTNNELEDANTLIENQERIISSTNDLIERRTEIEVARLKAADAAESAIIRATGRSLQAQREALVFANKTLAVQRDALDATSEAWFKLNDQIEKNTEAIEAIDTKTIVTSINLEKQLADERKDAAKKRAEDAKKAAEEAARKAKEQRAAAFADFKAGVELELLAAQEGSQQQLDIRKRLARAELQISLDNDKLTDNQRRLLVQQFFKERLKLEKDFAKERDAVTFTNIGAGIQADLAQLEVSNERKLELTETAIILQSQMEIAAAEGNSAKIEEINARRDKAVRDARIASIQEVVNYEIALSEATDGPEKRRLQAIASNTDEELRVRVQAINEVAAIESSNIQKRIDALNKEKEQKLISQKDYDLQYAQLVDGQTKIWEDAEKAKTDATKAEGEKRKQQIINEIQEIVQVAALVGGVIESLNDLQSAKENQKLDEQKQRLKELVDAGAITEKEAIQRQKRIDAEERRIKTQQAKRDRDIAVFKALLAIPQAVLQGLAQGGPILAIIYGALAAAQAAIVISRPIPKFGKGKKNSYEGPAEVGETGPELIEHNGRMYVADKPQFVWLGKKDKVFNPVETVKMMASATMNTERDINVITKSSELKIDYDKMGEAVGKYVQTNVYVDGVQEQAIRRHSFTQWLNKRRSF